MTHIWITKLTIIVSDNDLSPGQCKDIIWTNAGISYTFSSQKMHWKMSSGKWRPFCLCLNVLTKDAQGINDKTGDIWREGFMLISHISYFTSPLYTISHKMYTVLLCFLGFIVLPVTVSKIRENTYRSDRQVTLGLYGHFRCLQVLYSK